MIDANIFLSYLFPSDKTETADGRLLQRHNEKRLQLRTDISYSEKIIHPIF